MRLPSLTNKHLLPLTSLSVNCQIPIGFALVTCLPELTWRAFEFKFDFNYARKQHDGAPPPLSRAFVLVLAANSWHRVYDTLDEAHDR